jgi:tetratricopeptide (TPR) repeat protein
MTHLKLRLLIAASATAVLAACSSMGVPGFSEGGCRTVYVFTGGGVQPMNSCGALPREERAAKTLMAEAKPQLEAPLVENADPDAPAVDPAKRVEPVTPASAAALATAPHMKRLAPYPGANDMIEAGDMAAFMARVRGDYAKKVNAGAWGYVVVDALAAKDPVFAQTVIDGMASRKASQWMSANHLRAWVYAFNGNGVDAQTEMTKMRSVLPAATLLGHRALLAEGLGDTAAALAVYEQAPKTFDAPGADEQEDPTYFARARQFQSQRLLALRQAELLRGVNRDADAVALLTRLSAAAPDDGYIADRLKRAKAGQDKRPLRTLPQAMAQALGDEAGLIEEQEAIMSAMTGRGGKTPFNYLLSSMRQSALLLDPNNGEIRVQEVSKLHEQGKFEPALRLAQIGNPPKEMRALLYATAGLSALELGSPETLEAMTNESLKIDSSADAKIQAASALTTGNKTTRAVQLVNEALKQGSLTSEQQVFGLMTRAQAHLQAGNVSGAVADAQAAKALQDDESTQQFLASMLVEGPQRHEGLAMMRNMLTEQPDNTGLMNNFGYSLIDGHASDEELDEGFRLLKRAIRLTPDEPNLLDSIGWAYYQYGDFREANRFIEMALKAYEPFAHWELSDHMGDVKWRLGEEAEAKKFWEASLKAFPPNLNRELIEAKLKSGLTTPAPVRRDTPEVPRDPKRESNSDI